jgi:hypothetical protein
MGLDMMLFAKSSDDEISSEENQIFYWRKHPDLHGWMENLYRSRGGDGEFNMVQLELFNEDLDRLEKDVLADTLPSTTGFFFGKSFPEDKELDLQAIQRARDAIADGLHVFYDSWW